MRYVTTNIRLPEELWKSLKREAAERGRRFGEVVRELLVTGMTAKKKMRKYKTKPLCGVWKGIHITDEDIEEAKRSLFPPAERFFER